MLHISGYVVLNREWLAVDIAVYLEVRNHPFIPNTQIKIYFQGARYINCMLIRVVRSLYLVIEMSTINHPDPIGSYPYRDTREIRLIYVSFKRLLFVFRVPSFGILFAFRKLHLVPIVHSFSRVGRHKIGLNSAVIIDSFKDNEREETEIYCDEKYRAVTSVLYTEKGESEKDGRGIKTAIPLLRTVSQENTRWGRWNRPVRCSEHKDDCRGEF